MLTGSLTLKPYLPQPTPAQTYSTSFYTSLNLVHRLRGDGDHVDDRVMSLPAPHLTWELVLFHRLEALTKTPIG